MKKVAFFTEMLIDDFDGAARTMFQLINRIDPQQYNYFFIYGNGPQTFKNFLSLKVPTLNIPINDDYSMAIPQLIKQKLEQALDEFMPDMVHIATPSLLGFYALNYAKKRNIPVLTIYHTHFISYIKYYLRNISALVKPTEKIMKKAMNSFYNRCDLIYVPTSSIMEELKELGIAPEKLTLWQRGIDGNTFNPTKRNPGYLQQITKNNKTNILFASRLVWEKNIDTLIAIYNLIKKEKLPFNLIIVGDGAAKNTAMLAMPEAYFLGKLAHTELSQVYASADAFVFTSTSETYGNVVIEAMASGLPCVIANGGGSASLICHELTGFKCHPTQATDYVYYLKKLRNEPALRAHIIEQGLSYVKHLDWTSLANRYFDEVDSLTQSHTFTDTDTVFAWAN